MPSKKLNDIIVGPFLLPRLILIPAKDPFIIDVSQVFYKCMCIMWLLLRLGRMMAYWDQ